MKWFPWITLAALLVLGVVVNMLVAAGCALWSPANWQITGSKEDSDWAWGMVPPAWPAERGPDGQFWTISRRSGRGIEERAVFLWAKEDRSPWMSITSVEDQQVEVFAGWPALAVACRSVPSEAPPSVRGWQAGLRGPSRLQSKPIFNRGAPPEPRPIPYRPIPLGFTLNTLFYAAVLGALLLTFRAARRALRRRRGRCPTCAYDLKGTTTPTDLAPHIIPAIRCPECGTPRLPTARLPKASRGVPPRSPTR